VGRDLLAGAPPYNGEQIEAPLAERAKEHFLRRV
jgi:hypothetical protein